MIYEITQRETSILKATITEDGEVQDIRSDTVSIIIKKSKRDADADAVYAGSADVNTYGATGIAYWALTPSDTDLTPGTYSFAIKRLHGTEEYYPLQGHISVIHNLFD